MEDLFEPPREDASLNSILPISFEEAIEQLQTLSSVAGTALEQAKLSALPHLTAAIRVVMICLNSHESSVYSVSFVEKNKFMPKQIRY